MPAWRERHLTAQDGLRLFYRDYGNPLSSRLPLLCLTGLVRNSADYEELALRHSGERRVLCPDYRGRGRSGYDPDWRHYEPHTYVDDAAHLLAATGIGRALLVGTSLGGIVAMGLAVAKPTAVAAVVLNDIGPEVVSGGLSRILDYVGRDHPQPDWPSAVGYLKQLLPKLSLRTEAEWRRFAEGTYRAGEDGLLHFDWDVAVAKPLALGRRSIPDLWPYFRALGRVPVLALRGALSDLLSPEAFERMALAKPDLERIIVADTGHAPSLSEPDAAPAVDAFIRRF